MVILCCCKNNKLKNELKNNIGDINILKKQLSSLEAENFQNKEILKKYHEFVSIEHDEDFELQNEYDIISKVYNGQQQYVNHLKYVLSIEQDYLNELKYEYIQTKIYLDEEINETNALHNKINIMTNKLQNLDTDTSKLEEKLKISTEKINNRKIYLEKERIKLHSTIDEQKKLHDEVKNKLDNQITKFDIDNNEIYCNNIKELVNKLDENDENYDNNILLLKELDNILK